MKRLTLTVFALSLGFTALAVQVRHEKTQTANMILLPDAPPPDCAPDCFVNNLK